VSAAGPEELRRTAESLRRHGLEFAVLVTPPSVTYASGFEAPLLAGYTAELTGWLPSVALVDAAGGGCLVVADTDYAAARMQTWFTEIHSYEALGHFSPSDAQVGFARALGDALRATGLSGSKAAVGVEPALPRAAQEVLAEECPEVRLHDATAAIESARRLKTTREIGRLRQAVALADAGQRRLHELAAEGGETTDSAIWADVVAAVQTLAGRPVPVVGAIVTGTRTAVLTSPGPAGVHVVPGDLVLLDIGPRLGGYWADCCNTLVFGAEPDAAQLRYLRATRESCEAAIDALRPSRPCSDAANAIASTLERYGLEMAHYGGHQVGAGVNEPPRLLPFDETPIEPGMVFAVEAGAYAGPGGAVGARSEKLALVTEAGPELLSGFPW
jgi:Xaa-Pro aminopeptidase